MSLRMALLLLLAAGLPLRAENFSDIKPSPQQLEWQDLEIGVLIHFGPNTFMDREWGDGKADFKVFNPGQLDAEQWVTAAKAGGAKYLVMVAKHHDGFTLFPSQHTIYGVKGSPWKGGKGDVVKEVEEACRKHGLRFGVYLSPWDRHDTRYADNKTYDKYYESQLEELATRYGDLTEFWLDGAGSEGHVYDFDSYVEKLRTYQPNTLIFADVGFLPYGDIRWVGNEDGTANEENWNVIDRHGYLRWRPAEADTPLRKRHWFWHPNDEKSLNSLEELLDIYHKTVGRGAQLVLGLAPDNRGLLPESDVVRLKEFGEAVRKTYGSNLVQTQWGDAAETRTAAVDGDLDTVWTGREDATSIVDVKFRRPVSVDRAVTMEGLAAGQRVRQYVIQGRVGDAWKTLTAGTTIGHKKIDLFSRTTVSAVRLVIVSATGAPKIREFQVFDGGGR